MALENDPSSRVQIRSRGELLHPGCCALCGNGTFEGNYVDPSIFFDYEGHIYFCADCVTQMAETLGMFTADEHLELLAKWQEAYSAAQLLKVHLDDANSRLNAYSVVTAPTVSASDLPSPPVSEDTEGQPEVSEGDAEESGAGEPSPEEPVVSTGRSNVKRVESSNRKFT